MKQVPALVAPLGPLLLGIAAIAACEPVPPRGESRVPAAAPARSPLSSAQPSSAHPSSAPLSSAPLSFAPLVPIARQMRVAAESTLRVRVGTSRPHRYGTIRSLSGTSQLDAAGVPRSLDLELDLRSWSRTKELDGQLRAWPILGARRDAAAGLHLVRRGSTSIEPIGGTTVDLAGSLQIGGRTERLSMRMHVVRMPGAALRLFGRASLLPSRFGLPGHDAVTHIGRETELVLAWNLVLEPLPD